MCSSVSSLSLSRPAAAQAAGPVLVGRRLPGGRRRKRPPLIEDGRVVARNLRRERLTVDELEAQARQQQISELDQVRLAVLETNGRISFIPKSGGG
ncbi:MAG TPA: YetF domain-containing protein [Solirubrobacterales bacterium]